MQLNLDEFSRQYAAFNVDPVSLAQAFGLEPDDEQRAMIVHPRNAAGLVLTALGMDGVCGTLDLEKFDRLCRANPYACLCLSVALYQCEDLPIQGLIEGVAEVFADMLPPDVFEAIADLFLTNPILTAKSVTDTIQ